jgi:hypothetical protein
LNGFTGDHQGVIPHFGSDGAAGGEFEQHEALEQGFYPHRAGAECALVAGGSFLKSSRVRFSLITAGDSADLGCVVAAQRE